MRKGIYVFFLFFLVIVPTIWAVQFTQDYLNPLTRSIADKIYCKQNGVCVLENLTVLGGFFNITVNQLFINVSEIIGLNNTIEEIANASFLRLDTENDPLTGNLNVGENSLDNVENISVLDKIFLDDINHWITENATELFLETGSVMWFQHNVEHPRGAIVFLFTHLNKFFPRIRYIF